MAQPEQKPNDLPPPELTGKIIKVLYDVYNELGFGYQEKHYYRAIKLKLLALGFKVQEQLLAQIIIEGKIIGRYYLDFLVSSDEHRLVLELKVADDVYPKFVRQVLGYLKANNLKLGIIGTYGTHCVKIKRVVN